MGTDLDGIQEEPNEEQQQQNQEDDEGEGPRKIFFNMSLPADAVDENGHPTRHYKRNKVRTAKYTPLSFVPKNLWFQFHNIANVYFFALIILSVSFHQLRCLYAITNIRRSSQSLAHRIRASTLCP